MLSMSYKININRPRVYDTDWLATLKFAYVNLWIGREIVGVIVWWIGV